MKINVTVDYSVAAQKILVTNRQPAEAAQTFTLLDLHCVLLPYASIDSDGVVSLILRNIIQEWYINKDTQFNNPNYPQFHIEGEKTGNNGWYYTYKYEVTSHSTIPLDKPVSSVEEILALIVANQNVKTELESKLPELDAQSIRDYQLAHEKYVIQENNKALRKQLKAELETEYQNSFAKINQIRELIDGKQRVRTAQIETILDN